MKHDRYDDNSGKLPHEHDDGLPIAEGKKSSFGESLRGRGTLIALGLGSVAAGIAGLVFFAFLGGAPGFTLPASISSKTLVTFMPTVATVLALMPILIAKRRRQAQGEPEPKVPLAVKLLLIATCLAGMVVFAFVFFSAKP